MTKVNVRELDLNRLNSLTKYPSIPTYHTLGERGMLTDDCLSFSGRIVGTEKIDGTNSRVILFPDSARRAAAGDECEYLIGSREELLHAHGDLVWNPAQGIVEAIRATADRIAQVHRTGDAIVTLYFETFGGRVTANSRQYTGEGRTSVRLFDVAVLTDWRDLIAWPAERIAAWRDGGGQPFLPTEALNALAGTVGVETVPSLLEISATELPTGLEETLDLLRTTLPQTQAALDTGAGGQPEGIVVRTEDRRQIAKLRFEDYERTVKRRGR
jgi:hypothetical protein